MSLVTDIKISFIEHILGISQVFCQFILNTQSARSYCLKYLDTKHINIFKGAADIFELLSSGFKCDLKSNCLFFIKESVDDYNYLIFSFFPLTEYN